ncbi:MAG: nucleotidyltransferase family protein [bacterium]|nr:nucleotidyltransferase family protein [bacterium]
MFAMAAHCEGGLFCKYKKRLVGSLEGRCELAKKRHGPIESRLDSAQPRRFFAILPAAGKSLRMRPRHKLLLPWPSSASRRRVIDYVLETWLRSQVSRVVIVVREDDHDLREACQLYPVDVVTAEAPPHMKDTIAAGLRYVAAHFLPTPADFWVVAPADMPTLQSDLINAVLEAAESDRCLVPRFSSSDLKPGAIPKRGHPVVFPWSLAEQVHQLSDQQGIDHLLDTNLICWLDRPSSERPVDIDTPQEYERLLRKSQTPEI